MKKTKIKNLLLVLILILLVFVTVFFVGRSFGFFNYVKEGSLVNVITINGIEVEILNKEVSNSALNLENAYPVYDEDGLTNNPFEFSMTNTSSRSLSYSLKIVADEEKMASCILEDGSSCPELSTKYIKYAYKKDDGTYSEPKKLSDSGNIIASGVIEGKETITLSVIIWIDSEAGNEIMNHYFYGKLVIVGDQFKPKNLAQAILDENELILDTPTLTTSSNNTTDKSGLYKSTATNTGDPTYYFRGNIENNYVNFAGYTWRIVRINEDGTVRLIMQDGIDNNKGYRFNTNGKGVINMYYSESDEAKPVLENWYQENIINNGYSTIVASGNYYCEEAKVIAIAENLNNSVGNISLFSNYLPNFMCEKNGKDINNKGFVLGSIGLISYDEVLYAGGYYGSNNPNYYLYNNSINLWTMSPADCGPDSIAFNWYINNKGYIGIDYINDTRSLSPVLNLKADTYVTGSGISTNPYVVINTYNEKILNGADPVLTDNLVPVEISDDGTVKKADLFDDWYSYGEKRWANAVVLTEEDNYNPGDTIEEEKIESYFVWIPKYSYQLWDLGDYSSLTTLDTTKPHAIPIKFGLTNTSDTNTGECTSPQIAGESGNCKVGDYMTHPAFLAFDSNGFWVGKFETGYEGATTLNSAQVSDSDSDKIIIKPNVYAWRGNTIGNMFKASYNYIRVDESHMMKNTEWGAVAYLSHSIYGSTTSLRVNNNYAYITGYSAIKEPLYSYGNTSVDGLEYEVTEPGKDGTYTLNYFNQLSNLSSTNGNKSGIYDMSGGSFEYVMGYAINSEVIGGNSEITNLYLNIFTDSSWNKYYDKYTADNVGMYYNRILGDATGEMGPFAYIESLDTMQRTTTSWYNDYGINFVNKWTPWFHRGSSSYAGISAGNFAFGIDGGHADNRVSFRIVLTPMK